MFCQGEDSEDSIEHLVHCKRIHDFFPHSLKRGVPASVPVGTFFLLGLRDNECVAVSIFMFALYTMHNELRHNPCHADLNKTIFRIMAEVYMPTHAIRAWEEVFGLRPPMTGFHHTPPAPPSARRASTTSPSLATRQYPDDTLLTQLGSSGHPDEMLLVHLHVPSSTPVAAAVVAPGRGERPDERMPPSHIYIPDTSSDIHNPFAAAHTHARNTSSDIFVPDTGVDRLYEF